MRGSRLSGSGNAIKSRMIKLDCGSLGCLALMNDTNYFVNQKSIAFLLLLRSE